VSSGGRLRVVELAGGVAGAVCGRMFASLGHDVVRYEPPTGDPLARQEPVNDDGVGLAFVALNAGKRRRALSLRWDPDDDAGLDRADVVVLDVSPRAWCEQEAEVTADDLTTGRPELVVVRISGLGLDAGEDVPTDSLLAESWGGLATMIGDPSARPLSLGGEQAAYCAGVAGFLGAVVALRRRGAGAGGDLVDVCLADVAAYMDWKGDVGFAETGVAPRRSGPQPGDWRLVRALDGWVGCIFQQEHWSGVVEMVGDHELTDPALVDPAVRAARGHQWWPVIERWASTLPAQEIYARAQTLGLPFGWVCSSADLVGAEQLRARGFLVDSASFDGRGPAVHGPVRATGLPWTSGTVGELEQDPAFSAATTTSDRSAALPPVPAAPDSSRAPLDGVVVLDFGTITAGAAVTRLLADYGATVVKVESPDRPDRFRRWKLPPEALTLAGASAPTSPYFASNNVGKLSLALDLKSEEGRRVVHALAKRSHVLVENYRVGVTARLGIDAPTIQRINPTLVHLSLSSQGQTGPEAGYTSYGSTLDLLSGLASVTGYGPEEPRWSSSDVNYPDQLVAFFGAALVTYCLQFAPGAALDVSQREVVSWTLAAEIAEFMLHGVGSSPQGNRRPGRTPHDTFPCRVDDTWVAIACGTDAERRGLARLIGADALADGGEASWLESSESIDEQVRRWTRGLTREEAAAALRAAGVPAVPVLDAADRATTPGLYERGVITTTASGPVKGTPLRLRGYGGGQSLHAPRLGEHTRAILRDLAGQSDAEIDRLESLGVVTCTP
jgi:crotonobetainyl-CoA:carnitine CoA-transferase CaiB-like acyl-CoA transferase